MGAAHAGKAAEQVNMVQKSGAKTSSCPRIVVRDPVQQVLQIG